MTVLEQLAVLAAGFGAGILTSTVGVASLVSFPVLVAVGLPPVIANASNTVGMTPAGMSGSFGYRAELRAHPGVSVVVLVTCAIGAVAGALLLLALPSELFEVAAPWLILFTCLLVGAQPTISRLVRRRHDVASPGRTGMSPVTTAFAALTGVYGGYFGAGAGVMMMAVLGFGLDLDLRTVNALKTLAVLAANAVASLIFLVLADLDWTAILVLAFGSAIGGYVGARIGRKLAPAILRTSVVIAGVIAALIMLV